MIFNLSSLNHKVSMNYGEPSRNLGLQMDIEKKQPTHHIQYRCLLNTNKRTTLDGRFQSERPIATVGLRRITTSWNKKVNKNDGTKASPHRKCHGQQNETARATIKTLHGAGHSARYIAKDVGYNVKSVYKVIKQVTAREGHQVRQAPDHRHAREHEEETNPRVRKVGVQRRAGSDSYEVVRGEPIHLQFPRDLFWAEDYIELSLRHCDSRYWHYPENRIHACPKHNLFAERENEEARRYPLKVLEHPSDQMSCRVDLASFMFNMNGLVNKENLVLQFACCGRESHNMGDDSEARTWALHINGTTQGRLFETKLELQVYTTLRNRGDITRKRKLNQSTIKEEVDLDDEEIRIRYKALKQEELE
ncbi:hypothetical protein TCAL_15111, partial [Tigriopus californicus]